MTAQEGEEICGTFKMWSNNRTNRDLGFEVCVQHEGELKYFKEKKKYDMKQFIEGSLNIVCFVKMFNFDLDMLDVTVTVTDFFFLL